MGKAPRLDVFMEKHIGFGIRWNSYFFKLDLSISIMCFTFVLGIGKRI